MEEEDGHKTTGGEAQGSSREDRWMMVDHLLLVPFEGLLSNAPVALSGMAPGKDLAIVWLRHFG